MYSDTIKLNKGLSSISIIFLYCDSISQENTCPILERQLTETCISNRLRAVLCLCFSICSQLFDVIDA